MNNKQTVFKELKRKVIIFLILSYTSFVDAQIQGNRMFFSGNEIVVDVLPGNDIVYSHTFDKGSSIYSLAEVFQVEVDKVFRVSKLNPTQPINDGKIVKIPINRDLLLSGMRAGQKNYLALHYQVKKGESMFRIAKEYFNTDVSTIISLNKKPDEKIQTGEKLLIGYLLVKENNKNVKSDVKKNPAIATKEVKDEKKTATSQADENDKVPVIKYYLSDVIGLWDKNAESKSYVVLHDEAKIGTVMDIYNPMLKSHVKAKVLGKIPSGTYSEEVQLIISTAIARDLGILDSRFKVNIKYEQ